MTEEKKIQCEICKKEIPLSVAKTEEGREYIHHFCSEACHKHYFADHAGDKPKARKK